MKSKHISVSLSRKERKALLRTRNQVKSLLANPCFILFSMPSAVIAKGKLGFSKSMKDGDFVIKSKAIYDALDLNEAGFYTPPFSDMADFLTAIDKLETCIQNVKVRVLGAAAAKKVAKTDLYNFLKSALEYINKMARNKPLSAEEIITGANMLVCAAHKVMKPQLSAKPTGAAGEVNLQCIAVQLDGKYYKATYNWQISSDGGKTWDNLSDTVEAKLKVIGLVVTTTVKFRQRANSKKFGITAWCTPVDYTVM